MSGLGGPRFFDVYVPALGTDIRIQATDLFAGEGIELQALWNGQSRMLTLQVAEDEGPRMQSRDKPPYSSEIILENPDGLEQARLPLTLKLFERVAVVVYGCRGDLGQYGDLGATLWTTVGRSDA